METSSFRAELMNRPQHHGPGLESKPESAQWHRKAFAKRLFTSSLSLDSDLTQQQIPQPPVCRGVQPGDPEKKMRFAHFARIPAHHRSTPRTSKLLAEKISGPLFPLRDPITPSLFLSLCPIRPPHPSAGHKLKDSGIPLAKKTPAASASSLISRASAPTT